MSMSLGGVRPGGGTSPRRPVSPGVSTARVHYTNPIDQQPPNQAAQTTREQLLEEKTIFLANELASRDASIDRLERENLERLREVSRIRREMQQKRDEEVRLISEELKQCHQDLNAMRARQDAEVSRRVREELLKHGITASTTTVNTGAATKPAPNPSVKRVPGVTGNKAPPAGGPAPPTKSAPAAPSASKKPAAAKETHSKKAALQAEKLTGERNIAPVGGSIPLGQTPKPKSNARQMGDHEATINKGKAGRKFKGIGPQAEGEPKALFEDGLAYRLEDGDNWSFYNDTPDYELHLNWSFGPSSRIETQGDASMSENSEGWFVVNQVIYPDETKAFVQGYINGWKSSYSLKPLSDEYRSKLTAAADAGVQKEIRALEQACFENGVDSADEEAILNLCKKKRLQYVDLSFRPIAKSISRPGVDERLPTVPWQKPMQYLPPRLKETICLFNGIDPNDIDQGSLGDCWFLCAIASVAEFPDLIRAIYAPNGASDLPGQKAAYTVRLNKHGWWRDLVVDSYFPTTGGRPCFAQTCETPGEMWVALLEKAYAKLHGSYAAIAGGYPLHALIDLTGFAGMNITPRMEEARTNPGAAQELFDDMCDWDQRDFMISVGTPGVDESDYNVGRQGGNDAGLAAKYKEAGLVPGHAYSVLAAKSIPQHGLRLLQIRNPWGNSKEWTGEWADDDPRWKSMPDVAQICNYTNADDGTFWMPFRKFLEYFEDGQVVVRTKCRLDSRVKGTFRNGVPSCILKINVTRRTECMITLSQKDPRAFVDGDYDKKKQAMLLTLAKGEEGGRLSNRLCSATDPFKPTDERMFRYDRDQSMFLTLEPTADGTPHFIIPRIYDDAVEKEYVLAIRVPPTSAHRGEITVDFVSFSNDAPPFQNYATFGLDDCGVRPFSTDCQSLNRDSQVLKHSKRATGMASAWRAVFEGADAPPAPPKPTQPAVPAIPQQQQYQDNTNNDEQQLDPGAGRYYDPNDFNQQQQQQGGGGNPFAQFFGRFGPPGRGRGRGRGGGRPQQQQQGIPPEEMQALIARIDRFYNYYEPSKAGPHSVQVAEKYQHEQDLLFARLTQKYGPEPGDWYDEEGYGEEEDDDWW